MLDLQEKGILSQTESILFKGNSVKAILESQQESLVSVFNRYGCVLLDCSSSPGSFRDNLLALTSVFGTVIRHRSSDQDGIVTITPTDASVYLGLTYEPFQPHTDGSFLPNPPQILALQCEIPSERGGWSQIIQVDWLYHYLAQVDSQGLQGLFDPDAISVTTSQSSYTQPIFRRDNRCVQMAFRTSDMQLTVTPKSSVKPVFEALMTYISDPTHQLIFKLESHQIVVADNTRILHGRTEIPNDEPQKRKMQRLWMDGQSQSPIQIGFIPQGS